LFIEEIFFVLVFDCLEEIVFVLLSCSVLFVMMSWLRFRGFLCFCSVADFVIILTFGTLGILYSFVYFSLFCPLRNLRVAYVDNRIELK